VWRHWLGHCSIAKRVIVPSLQRGLLAFDQAALTDQLWQLVLVVVVWLLVLPVVVLELVQFILLGSGIPVLALLDEGLAYLPWPVLRSQLS
jgi:hypothetical protein